MAWMVIAALGHGVFVAMGCLLQLLFWLTGQINELVLMYRSGMIVFVPLLVWAIMMKVTKDHEKSAWAIMAAGGMLIFWTMMMTTMSR